ncbi:MAG: HEPN domain-containing protein [Chloroflexi bacterium]|nr:HEPN domain-containing protein [Chloroflexota bacterium]
MPDEPNQTNLTSRWFLRAEHDLQTAQIALRAGGPTDTVAILLQQAVEKYLKGYLLSKGWKLKKIHDLEELVTKAAVYDKALAQFLDLCRALSASYLQARYPDRPAEDYTPEETADMLKQTEKLISKIKEAVGK